MPDRECQVHGDFCLIEGDVQVGLEGQFGEDLLALFGNLPHPEVANATDRRRLDIVNGFNAFYWPSGVVRGRDVYVCVCHVGGYTVASESDARLGLPMASHPHSPMFTQLCLARPAEGS